MLPNTKPLPSEPVRVVAGAISLVGDLVVPEVPRALVVFAPESAGGRNDPRNRAVANVLNRDHYATLLFDPLMRDEETVEVEAGRYEDDVATMRARLLDVLQWTRKRESIASLPVCIFAIATGASAALALTTEDPSRIAALVIAAPPPGLLGQELSSGTPTLVVIGEEETQSGRLGREIAGTKDDAMRIESIAGIERPYDDPKHLDEIARMASAWFTKNVVH